MPIPWLDERFGFYAIPGNFSIAKSETFKLGRIYGMDVSSGAAVAALLSDQKTTNMRVLDLCCSPGLKLCMIADLLSSSSTVVGVDISENRLAVCKRIVKKYHVDPRTSGDSSSRARIRLYCADGTKFGSESDPELVFDSVAAAEDQKTAGKRKRMNKSARARERKRLRQHSSLDKAKPPSTVFEESCQAPLTIEPFDYVLVDAECSTDGSLKHVQKRALKNTNDDTTGTSNPSLTDPKKLESLVDLQKGLISSGFKLLKPDGILVYSTCSLSTDQNESVVNWLLNKNEDASIIPVAFPLARSKRVVNGSLEGTVRFLPGSAATNSVCQDASVVGSGFFLAKLGKQSVSTDT